MKAHTSVLLLAALYAAAPLSAALPDSVPYQGRIAVSGLNFTGTGQFKFAVYQQPSAGGEAALLWTNATGATTGVLAEPATGVALPVVNGLYIAALGDTAIPSMAALPASLEPDTGHKAFVRVWFNDGTHGFQPLSPDTELRAVPFAREAASAANVGGIAAANLARLDSANHFVSTIGIMVSGDGPRNAEPAEGAKVPVSGAGTRMMFLPGYAAFRAGIVDGAQWNADNVGLGSVAMGYDTIASLSGSTAMGYCTTASGNASTATGWYTSAKADASTASGYFSAALGGSSTAMGYYTTASGESSTAIGWGTTASGESSTAMGNHTAARSFAETVLGTFNTYCTPISDTNWEAIDRLFVIGNGTADTPSDALVMLKNGGTTLNGTLKVNHVDGLAVIGTGPSASVPPSDATVPISGAGTRMLFLPGYGAFRAGTVSGNQWDSVKVGLYSTALGCDNTASGDYSTALGYLTTASEAFATAMGANTNASGNVSTSMGVNTNARGDSSTAMGSLTNASGGISTAMGSSTTASGLISTAMGDNTTAPSFAETALGTFNTYYTPISDTNWESLDRLFVIGNGTWGSPSDALVMLKNGDTTFSGSVLALTLTPTSDRNRKTDIVPADTAAILAGVATLPIATWKFKAETVTHLGPMAQDFAAAFHLGASDTGIATVDADGVALAAIQELNKRVNSLSQENAALKSEVGDLKTRLSAIEAKLVR